MIFYFNTRLNQTNKKDKTIESRITETEEKKTPHDRVYKRKLNRDIWKTDLPETESSEDEVSDNENVIKENQQKSAYSKKKSKEIREGKRKEAFNEASSSTSTSRKLSVSYENSINYMLQLIRGLEEKIQHMEWEAPNRS